MCVPIQTKKALPDLLNKPCNFKGVKLQKKALTLKKSSRIRVIFQFSRILDSSDLQLSLLYISQTSTAQDSFWHHFLSSGSEKQFHTVKRLSFVVKSQRSTLQTQDCPTIVYIIIGVYDTPPPSVVLIRFRSIWKAVENAATTRKGDARCVLSQSPCSPSPS